MQGRLAVFYIDIGRRCGLALEDEAVKARPLELGCGPAAHVGISHCTGERRLGDDGQAPAHVDVRAGQRAVHHAKHVLRGKRFDIGTVVEYVLHAQPARANILLGVALVDALVLNRAG